MDKLGQEEVVLIELRSKERRMSTNSVKNFHMRRYVYRIGQRGCVHMKYDTSKIRLTKKKKMNKIVYSDHQGIN